jgi:hypothetical protein
LKKEEEEEEEERRKKKMSSFTYLKSIHTGPSTVSPFTQDPPL